MRLVTFLDSGRVSSGYATPLLAALMRPVHEIRGNATPAWIDTEPLGTDGLRYFLLRRDGLAEPAVLPDLSAHVRIAFALLCARSVYTEAPFVLFTESWLSDADRRPETAYALFGTFKSLPPCDRAYVAHWATMSAAFPHDPELPAQTAALIAAYVCPQGTFDFSARATAALAFAE